MAAQTRDRYQWSEDFGWFDLHGQRDLPPPEIVAELSFEIGGEFHCAVECLTEISMSVHLGAITRQPQQFLQELLEIVGKHGIRLPKLNDFVQRNGRGSLASAIDDETLIKWRTAITAL